MILRIPPHYLKSLILIVAAIFIHQDLVADCTIDQPQAESFFFGHRICGNSFTSCHAGSINSVTFFMTEPSNNDYTLIIFDNKNPNGANPLLCQLIPQASILTGANQVVLDYMIPINDQEQYSFVLDAGVGTRVNGIEYASSGDPLVSENLVFGLQLGALRTFSGDMKFVVEIIDETPTTAPPVKSDIEPPVGPTHEIITNVTQTSVDIQWPAASDNVGVVSYNIYQDGTLVKVVDSNTLSTSISGLIPSTSYRFVVTSSDAEGNESSLRLGRFVVMKHSTCGVINNWVGASGNWGENPEDWSENAIANACQDVLIDNGAAVTVLQGESFICSTLEVGLGSELIVERGSELFVVDSQTGPFTLFGDYYYEIPGCDNNGNPEINCTYLLTIWDSVNCVLLLGGDIIYGGTYTINGDILTIDMDPGFQNYCPAFKIIDNETLIRIGTTEIWSPM